MTLKFQTFTEVLVLGEEAKVDSSAGKKQKPAQVYLFNKSKQEKKKQKGEYVPAQGVEARLQQLRTQNRVILDFKPERVLFRA